MKSKMINSKSILISFIPLTVLAGGCGVNLENIQALSRQGSATSGLYPEVIQDFYDSCIRTSEYQFGSESIPIIPIEEAITGASEEESKFLQSCNRNFRVITDNNERIEKIENNELNSITKSVILSEILKQYFDEMGQLAGADVNFTQATTDLANAVQGLPDVATTEQEQAQFSAGFNILGFALNIIADQIRRRTLRREIIARDNDIGIVTEALEETLKVYKTRLFMEENRIKLFYGSAIEGLTEVQESEKRTIPSLIALETLLKSNWNDARSILRDKLNISNGYAKALKQLREQHTTVSKTLASIASDGKLADSEVIELNALIAQILQDLEPSMRTIRAEINHLKQKEIEYKQKSSISKVFTGFYSDKSLSDLEKKILDDLISNHSELIADSSSQVAK